MVHYDLWVLTLYCPFSNSDEENATLIEIMLEFCQGREVVVLGDFNLPSLVWSAGDGEFRGASERMGYGAYIY